jgi:hypothetical protein
VRLSARAQSAADAGCTVRAMQAADVDRVAEVHVQVWRDASPTPGSRFLVAPDHEDVWEDETLLDTSS